MFRNAMVLCALGLLRRVAAKPALPVSLEAARSGEQQYTEVAEAVQAAGAKLEVTALENLREWLTRVLVHCGLVALVIAGEVFTAWRKPVGRAVHDVRDVFPSEV